MSAESLPPAPSPPEGAYDAEISTLYDEEAEQVIRYLRSTGGGLGRADAEDIVQDAFLIARCRWAEVRTYDAPVAFVFGVARRLRMNYHRTQARRGTDPLRDEATTTRHQPDLDAVIDLQTAIDRLPDRQQQVIVLRELVGLSVRDTAKILAIAEGTVKSTRSDALTNLKAMLQERADEKKGEVRIHEQRPNS